VQIAVDPSYLDRFGDALADLGVNGNDRMLLAVSGGPDSLAMLLLARLHSPANIVAATVDHQLRPESADEATYVSRICHDLAVPHITLVPRRKISGNIQSSARAARYELLAEAAVEHGCSLIATAHHGGDQLETLLMRLARGSGVSGMAGIRPRNGQIIRPLLGFSKRELEDICAAAGLGPVHDSSNDNPDFDRVAMRQWLANSSHPFDTKAINRTASALGDAAAALDWMAGTLAETHIANGNEIALNGKGLPKEMQRRLLLLALRRIDPAIAPRGEAIERLIADLCAGRTATIGDILCQGGDIWRFSMAPPRRVPG
jgi:tRNA(Ile)-lysidine synthase